MCGIIGYVGNQPATPILLQGLRRLEYRGYDSTGIAVVSPDGGLHLRRALGKLAALEAEVRADPMEGCTGIGHTRWATHGKPSKDNAHPHSDCSGRIVVIHNGIIENFAALKRDLLGRGHHFQSETDTEILAHLLEEGFRDGQSLEDAFRGAVQQLQGASAVMAMAAEVPDRVIAARVGNAGGIVVGKGSDGMYLASDLPALIPYTRRVAFLGNREMATVTAEAARFADLDGRAVGKDYQTLSLDSMSASKGGYKHFMLKEIMEQPESVTNCLRGRIEFDPPGLRLAELDPLRDRLQRVTRVVLLGMGTSWHAAMLGRVFIERLARLPTEVENASEMRYREPVLGPDTLVVSVGQSGETVDTLAAMEEAGRQGSPQVTLCNMEGSQATRVADATILLRAGLEVAVCSTKTLLSSTVALFLLAAHLGRLRDALPQEQMQELCADLAKVPALLGDMVTREREYQLLANRLYRYNHFLFLGRGVSYPVALEGALKLKEVSYIHAEGYAAGEMKHGPIALIDERMPIVAVAPRDGVHDKMYGNIQEVKARDGIVIALVTEGDEDVTALADGVVTIPAINPLLSPLLSVVPLQFLAYHVALRRGCDVDQPRNLAKTVTVE